MLHLYQVSVQQFCSHCEDVEYDNLGLRHACQQYV